MATSKKSNGKKLRVQTSSVAATLVNLLVKQASGEVKKIRATCGRGFEKPLANYNPDTQSWKMLEDISLWGDSPSLVNLPPSGMTRSGVLYLRPAWEPIIGETASSSWPTPTAVTRPMEGNVRLYRAKIEAGEMTEAEAEAILGKSVWKAQGKVKEMWPTPTTQEVEHPEIKLTKTGRRKSKDGTTSHSLGLADAVLQWPTPTARDWKGAAGFKDQNRNLADLTFRAQILDGHRTWPTPTHGKLAGGSGAFQKIADLCSDGKISDEERKAMQAGNGGSLNPMWVEWLMGFPPGWTDLKDSETL
jgi:DNA (cytosine-5)-methyltransferase 1